jgi:hypothetical protein
LVWSKTSALVDDPHQMLRVIQHFGKHCCYHLQGEYVLGVFRKPYVGQAVGGEWDMTDPFGGAGEQAAIQLVMRTWLRKGKG